MTSAVRLCKLVDRTNLGLFFIAQNTVADEGIRVRTPLRMPSLKAIPVASSDR